MFSFLTHELRSPPAGQLLLPTHNAVLTDHRHPIKYFTQTNHRLIFVVLFLSVEKIVLTVATIITLLLSVCCMKCCLLSGRPIQKQHSVIISILYEAMYLSNISMEHIYTTKHTLQGNILQCYRPVDGLTVFVSSV